MINQFKSEIIITSLQHPLVKHLVKLRNDRKYRTETQTAIISGLKLINELSSLFLFKTLLIQEGYIPNPPIKAKKIYTISHSIMKKITGLQTPEPLAAEIEIPAASDLKGKYPLLILDGISDPGNLGTLLRSALALGWKAVFLTPNTTDPFNEKALRAAKGATFKLKLKEGSYDELFQMLQQEQLHLMIADAKGEPISPSFSFLKQPIALAMGNESHGVHPDLRQLGQLIAVPIDPQMESLNVSTAASILMFYLRADHVQK